MVYISNIERIETAHLPKPSSYSLLIIEVIFPAEYNKIKILFNILSSYTLVYIYTFNLCPSPLPWGQTSEVLLLLTSEPQGWW